MKEKPKYSLGQNLIYLSRVCRRETKALPVCTAGLVALELLNSLAGITIGPAILRKVEQRASLAQMLLTILLYTLALAVFAAGLSYLRDGIHVFRSRLYDAFDRAQARKAAETSYPNTLDPAFHRMQELAYRVMGGTNVQTPPVAMVTLTGELCTAVLGFGLYLLLLKGLPPILLALVVGTTASGFFAGKYAGHWEFQTREEAAKYRYEMLFVTNTAMSNEMPKDIRLFHMQPWLMEIYDKALGLYRGYCGRRERRFLWAKAADVLLTLARNGIAYAYLIHTALNRGQSASLFLLQFSAVTGFTVWITTILDSLIALHRESRKLCGVREFLEWPEPFRMEEGEAVPRSLKGYALRLENVSFRYPKAEKDTICGMNLTIHPGEKLAIVGLNGAGKSTLVKLLCGLLDPTEGRVLLNGEDIRQFDRRDYYRLFTTVFQEHSLFSASLAANIAQSETDIDMERVEECVKNAGLEETISQFPDGLSTNLGKALHDDGIELSGGQEQRLLLARALYKDASILLLDEPTAALDPIAENDMYLRYDAITRGRTAVYISHRLASTRFCDRVLFLKDGQIAEAGTHEELLALGGEYAALFEVQSRYYREGGADHEA